MLRIGIIEDDHDIRETLCEFIEMQHEFTCDYKAASVEEFFEILPPKKEIDILILDINLPGISGIDALPKIKARMPGVEVIMCTVFNDSEKIFRSLCAGASGYIIKNTPFEQLKEAILCLHNGGSPLTPTIARKVIEYFQVPHHKFEADLTEHEKRIVNGMIDGLSYKLIADRLDISIDTVRFHVKKIYKKLQINSKAELINGYYGKKI
jgi:DNA-binding NarL/FixJ family response regulator